MSQKQEQEHFISGNTPALFDPLSVIVLGSGGPAAAGRASSGYLVLVDGEARFLVDAGSGIFTRLGESVVMDTKQTDTNSTTELARVRTLEAADRTLMAWIRTSLSLIGFGFTANKVLGVLEAGKSANPHGSRGRRD